MFHHSSTGSQHPDSLSAPVAAASRRTWPMLLGMLVILVICCWLEVYFHLYHHVPFDEPGLVTRLSVLQLTTIAVFLARIATLRRRSADTRSWHAPWVFWALCAAAFAYLALDEEILLHEGIGHMIRDAFGGGKNPIAARADDFTVAFYGLAALGIVWHYRTEILRNPRSIGYGAGGFFALAGMVLCDILSHRNDVIGLFITDPDRLDWAMGATENLEEILKLLGEIFFLGAAHAALRRVMADTSTSEAAWRDDPPLSGNTRIWQWSLFCGLLLLAALTTLIRHPELFWRIRFLHLPLLGIFAWLAARGMGSVARYPMSWRIAS